MTYRANDFITSRLYRKLGTSGVCDPEVKPYVHIAGAVMIQALLDIADGDSKHRELAYQWFLDPYADSEFPFELCCTLLGRKPIQVRAAIISDNFVKKRLPELLQQYKNDKKVYWKLATTQILKTD